MNDQTVTLSAAAASPGGASVELGLDTFGDVTVDRAGALLPHGVVLSHVVEEAVLA